jgi:hypothetical protein
MFEAPSLSGLFSLGVQCRGSVPESYRKHSVEVLMPMILLTLTQSHIYDLCMLYTRLNMELDLQKCFCAPVSAVLIG